MSFNESSIDVMSEDWFDFQVAPDGVDEDGCRPEEAQALKDYLRGKTTTQEAAVAITRPTEATDTPTEEIGSLWGIFENGLLELAESEVARLLQLLDAIQNLPYDEGTAELKHPDIWAGLEGFGHLWLDASDKRSWRGQLHEAEASGDRDRDMLQARRVKREGMEARLSVAKIGFDGLSEGYDCLAEALEDSAAILDFEIPIVAAWLAVAARQMYEEAVKGRPTWAFNLDRDRKYEGEEEKMSLGRWQLWQERLERLAADRDQPAIVSDAAKAAVRDMKAAKVDYETARKV